MCLSVASALRLCELSGWHSSPNAWTLAGCDALPGLQALPALAMICVECGQSVNDVLIVYSAGNIRLTRCVSWTEPHGVAGSDATRPVVCAHVRTVCI